MKILPAIAIIFLISVNLSAQNEPEFKMVQYYFVELIRNNDRPELDSASVMEIQKGHMDNMKVMAEAGKLLCAGPFGDENGGGIWILRTETYEEAQNLCESDPAVINKRLLYKIRPWWTSEATFTSE